MEIKINVVNEIRKMRNTAYSDRTSWVEELIQNAQRAKAKIVTMILEDDYIVFEDNGIGCSDPGVLFEKSSSGWGSDIASQNPFGEGFFSTMMIANKITVESIGFRAVFDVNKIILQENIDCVDVYPNKSRKKGMKVTLEELEDYEVQDIKSKFVGIAERIPNISFAVKCNDTVFSVKYKPFTECDKKFSVVLNNHMVDGYISPFSWGCSKDGYDGDGIEIYCHSRFVKEIPYNGVSGMLNISDDVLDLRSPDRKDIIHNEKYNNFMDYLNNDIEKMMIDIVKNGSDEDIDYYNSSISRVLTVNDYAKYIRFVLISDVDTVDTKKIPEDTTSLKDVIGTFEQVGELSEFKHSGTVSPNNVSHIISINGGKRTGCNIEQFDTLMFYVKTDQVLSYEDNINLARYYKIPVVLCRNTLEENVLNEAGITHISKFKSSVNIDLNTSNIGIINGIERRASYVFSLISGFCGFNHNIFKICNMEAYKRINIKDKEVTNDIIKVMGVAMGNDIFIDREYLIWSNLEDTEDTKLLESDKRFISVNMEIIAHELAHIVYGTVDNTVEHSDAQIMITNTILKSMYKD